MPSFVVFLLLYVTHIPLYCIMLSFFILSILHLQVKIPSVTSSWQMFLPLPSFIEDVGSYYSFSLTVFIWCNSASSNTFLGIFLHLSRPAFMELDEETLIQFQKFCFMCFLFLMRRLLRLLIEKSSVKLFSNCVEAYF